tara:strand:+ start:91 stop:729 length:639 start_codon:yes stop_codon:yes gene_type:complete
MNKFDKIFIIHRKIDVERDVDTLIKKVIKYTSNPIEIIEPVELGDSESLICFWSKKLASKKSVISLYNTNIKLYERIVKEKLDNVLILEDDAELNNDIEIKLDYEAMIHFLDIRTWKNRNVSCLANFYPSWKETKRLLEILNEYRRIKKNKHRPIDLELDYAKSKYFLNFNYSSYFHHPKVNNISTLGNSQKLNDDGSNATNITKSKIKIQD